MNRLNVLDAQGFGALWLSCAALRDPEVKVAIGVAPGDALLGWIYVGTPANDRPSPPRPEPDGFRRWWSAP